jgi:tetratricopeptide (TPR) repeat protein
VSRSIVCRRCGGEIPIPAEAITNATATLTCPGCGQRYARKSPSPTSAATAHPTASAYTSQGTIAPSVSPAPGPADPGARHLPTTSIGGAKSLEPQPGIFAPGDFVANRYRVVRFIARGGMGEVFEAEDLELRGRIALKTIHAHAADEPGAIDRFKREIQLARRVTHPNVCRIFDVGFHESEPGRAPVIFFTMELLEGETLAVRLKRSGRLSTAAALPIARQLTAALTAAHEAGIVHRDFKTENVFLVPTPDRRGGERAVVTDFGIARGGGGEEGIGATLTSAGSVIGTPAYMAPEQIAGDAVTPATDQYALGVVLFEMVTGELPFHGDNPLATAARRLTEPPPSPREFVPGIEPAWEAAILRCLERRPEARFRDVSAVGRAIAGESSQPLALPSPPDAPLAKEAPRRGDRRKALVAVLLLVALAGASTWAWLRVRAIRDRLAIGAPVGARRAVAVLGLRNLSGRPEAAWLSTALAEMLGTELGRGATLRVLPGEAVASAIEELQLSGRDRLEPEARQRLRRRLGVDYLVLGGYTSIAEGGALRLDLRLEDARADETVATVGENGTEAQMFDLVARSGAALRQALGAKAEESAARAALPTSPEATRLYAQGLEALRSFDPQRGRDLLEKAVAADPDNALTRSALASAWASLGYPARAEQEGRKARELAAGLPAEDRLVVEARYFEAAHDWGAAAGIWERLWTAYPDVAAYGLGVAACRTRAGEPEKALAAALALRNLPPPEGEDPRIDLAEATAAGALADFRREADAAARAAERAEAEGAQRLTAEALIARGWALRNLGRAAEARAAIDRGRALFDLLGDRAAASSADAALGGVLLDMGDVPAARAAFDRSLSTARELGDRAAETGALNNLAVLARNRGENEAARASYESALAIFEETGDRVGAAFTANNLAVCLTDLGEFAAAGRRAEQALAIWRESSDRNGIAAALGSLGGVRRRLGDLAGAEKAWSEALALRRETGQRPGEAVALNGLAQTLFDGGHLEDAADLFTLAQKLARELAAKSALAGALSGQADVEAARGDDSGARRDLAAALALRRELGERAQVARVRLALVRLDLATDPAGAATTARELLGGPLEERTPEVEGAARALAARALAASRDFAGARRALAAPALPARLPVALALDLRLAAARVEASAGRLAEAQHQADAARDEALQSGLAGVELEASLLDAELAGRSALAAFAARARAAGFEAIARRAEAAAR